MNMKLNTTVRYAAAVLALVMAGAMVPALAQDVGKIGVFDSKEVFEGSAEGQRLQKFLEGKRNEFKKSVDDKESEIRLLQQRLREGEFTLSEDKKSEYQKDLQRRLVELDSLRQEANSNLRIEVDDVQQQLNRKLLEVVGEVGAENSFAVILERKTQVVFASANIDITQMVIERFNLKYPEQSAAPGR